jgi:hypothetical protein
MTLYIHIYEERDGKTCEQVGIAYDYDAAMQWLDDWNEAMERSGCKYQCTRLIMDSIGDNSIQYRRDYLKDIEEWRAENAENARLDEEHERAVQRGIRSAQL